MGRKRKPPRCSAKTATGKRCKRRAVVGNRCKQHPASKGGRPQIYWNKKDWKRFDIFCSAHESQKDIAEAMGVDLKTIDAICRREKEMSFSKYCNQKRGWGRSMVAGKQLEVAMNGNVSMLTHLGKQWLGQKDPKQQQEHSFPDGKPFDKIVVEFVTPEGSSE